MLSSLPVQLCCPEGSRGQPFRDGSLLLIPMPPSSVVNHCGVLGDRVVGSRQRLLRLCILHCKQALEPLRPNKTDLFYSSITLGIAVLVVVN